MELKLIIKFGWVQAVAGGTTDTVDYHCVMRLLKRSRRYSDDNIGSFFGLNSFLTAFLIGIVSNNYICNQNQNQCSKY